MNATVEIELVPENLFSEIAARSLDISRRMKSQFFPAEMAGSDATWIACREEGDAPFPTPGAQLYAFGLRLLSHAFVGNAANVSEGSSSVPAINADYVRRLAIEGRIAKADPYWQVPTVEHVWNAELSRIEKLADDFSEEIYADP